MSPLPLFLSSLIHLIAAVTSAGGSWQLLQPNLGIVAMHMQLLHNDRVVVYDRTDFGASNLSLPAGKCRIDPSDQALTDDCTAHSVEYNVAANTFRPLTVLTDVWCSSASVSPDGSLQQTGGYNDGDRVVRIYTPCGTTSCDWQELGHQLLDRRWYATNHILPGGRMIIIGGRRAFNYEFYPKTAPSGGLYSLKFLVQTNEPRVENNLYPFVFLNSDGNLFVFANTQSILFDYNKNLVVRTYPEMPGGGARNYPSTGSAVLLPFRVDPAELEVMVCGGAPKNAYTSARAGKFIGALNTCGRIRVNDPNPQWAMETMPMPRVMGDMLILPNGQILIINGAGAGSAGWELGQDPVLAPVLYNPNSKLGSRFQVQTGTTIPRMYHSSAILLRDGRVLVGGSNPHVGYAFTNVTFPTELRLEAFSPSYLDSSVSGIRPKIVAPDSQSQIGLGQVVAIKFRVSGKVDPNAVQVTLLAPPFNTHSFSMNHRMLVLGVVAGAAPAGGSIYVISVKAPVSENLAPKGYYLLFVVHQEVPSEGIWVRIM